MIWSGRPGHLLAGMCCVVALTGALFHQGCLGGRDELPLGAVCTNNDECSGILVCILGRCRTECNFDRDCPEGQACVSFPVGSDERVCTVGNEGEFGEEDCPQPLVRIPPFTGRCREPCTSDDDCSDDRDCVDGGCIDAPQIVGPDAELPDADIDGSVDAPLDVDVTDDPLDGDEVSGDGDTETDGAGDGDVELDGGDVPEEVTAVTAGSYHTCVLLGSGSVKCWGWGREGRLGYGNTDDIGDDEYPSSVGYVDIGGAVTQVITAGSHTCALLDTGHVRCWGWGSYGGLGYGNTDDIGDDESPSSAGDVMVGATVSEIAAGYFHTCVLTSTGGVRCWGTGAYGQLGYGDDVPIGDDEDPEFAGEVVLGATVDQITAGGSHTCALLGTGGVRCWGYGFYGQLGYRDTENIGDDELPLDRDVRVGDTTVLQVEAGAEHTCALLDPGNVRCWGRGLYGRLGYGDREDRGDDEWPESAGDVEVGTTVSQITLGDRHTCGLVGSGSVRCWGNGDYGKLGYGNEVHIGDDEYPSSTGNIDVGGNITQVVAGGSHTCALLDTGGVRCWGNGTYGRLGYGDVENIGDDELPSSAGDVPIF